MLDGIRRRMLGVLRVPADPPTLQGSRDVRVFRAAANYYRYRLVLWGLVQGVALAVLLAGFAAVSYISGWRGHPLFVAAELLAGGAYIVQLVLTFALIRLDFELRWYLLSDRSLRIREGILNLREKTMTFANLQHISIRQNPLQRVLGLADVQVRTAGGGGGTGEAGSGTIGESMHEAWFRGVDNAETIRAAIQERVRQPRDSGLGDPDEPEKAGGGGASDAIAAARELQEEIRKLARVLAPRSG